MNRPWKIWLAFALCSAVLLSVMVWVSATVWRLDRAQAHAEVQADLEEKVRLALWRMDSMLAPLITQESARPSFAYTAFYAAERAYGKMYNPLNSGEVLVASPLLTQVSSNILLHFQCDTRGRLTSPQVPGGTQRDLAEGQYTTHEQIEAAAARLRDLDQLLGQEASPDLLRLVNPSRQTSPQPAGQLLLRNKEALLALAPAPLPRENLLPVGANRAASQRMEAAQNSLPRQSTPAEQQFRNDIELGARAQSIQQALDLNVMNSLANSAPLNRANLMENVLKPVWLGETLLLVRRVELRGREYLQGCWVDWGGTRRWLLEGINDLLPGARLERLNNNGEDSQARMLATLPVRLVPGAAGPGLEAPASPLLFALVLAWTCVLLAGVAVALLLQGTLSLSERRAAFVSAVTHELRTPLTTFKMYSEMLACGMVPDDVKRQEYLARLCAEADRLNHLVENVLAYARLERGSARTRIEQVTMQELMARVRPRLLQRAEQAGLAFQIEADPHAQATVVQVDVVAVEQILFNLVDNACKYAAPTATEKILHLEALPGSAKCALLRVRDHGPGISTEAARHLFQPFSKSAHEAACSAPGVGLGLALCRRLARSLGGDLRFNPDTADGACFELFLPIVETPWTWGLGQPGGLQESSRSVGPQRRPPAHVHKSPAPRDGVPEAQ